MKILPVSYHIIQKMNSISMVFNLLTWIITVHFICKFSFTYSLKMYAHYFVVILCRKRWVLNNNIFKFVKRMWAFKRLFNAKSHKYEKGNYNEKLLSQCSDNDRRGLYKSFTVDRQAPSKPDVHIWQCHILNALPFFSENFSLHVVLCQKVPRICFVLC